MLLLHGASRPSCARCALRQQIRHATLLRRPKRPYQFTQLITLSDGSTFLHRTTSPQAVLRSTKDTRNTLLWNPSSQKLMNVEEDEAGRLRRFRKRFGRGFDAESAAEDGEKSAGEQTSATVEDEDSFLDLIAAYVPEPPKAKGKDKASESMPEPVAKAGKGKGKKK